MSPRTPGYAITIAYDPDDTPHSIAYRTTDWGATWEQMSSPNINTSYRAGGTLHIPWPDNLDQNVVYYAQNFTSGTVDRRTMRTTGATAEDISPTASSHTFGPELDHFGIVTYDNDRAHVALAGRSIDGWAVFISSDYGDTWSNKTGLVDPDDPHAQHIAFASDSPTVLYMWGSKHYIAFTEDGGDTIVSKVGNLDDIEPSLPFDIRGLAGGDPLA
jgi:hypothetical protein